MAVKRKVSLFVLITTDVQYLTLLIHRKSREFRDKYIQTMSTKSTNLTLVQ